MPNHSGPGSTSSTGAHISAPQVKKSVCSSAWTASWCSAASYRNGQVPDVEVERPERQRDERMRRARAAGRVAAARSTGRSIGPVRPGHHRERREVAEHDVLDHVEEQELLLAERVDRRGERENERARARPEAPTAARPEPASRAPRSVRTRRE